MSVIDTQMSCCGATKTIAESGGSTRMLDVEFLYLDMATCERCQATDSSLKQALDAMSSVFDALGYQVRVDEVHITSRELAVQHHFLSSPTIRVNGVDIQTSVKESDCADCGSLSGCATGCRVFTWSGQDFEQPPAGMIVDGILRVLYQDRTPDETPYALPDNLEQFFAGVETTVTATASGCRCGSSDCC